MGKRFSSRDELESHIATTMPDQYPVGAVRVLADDWLREGKAVIGDSGERTYSDSERLEWLVFNSAVVHHSRDAEYCWVNYYEDDHTVETLDKFDNARDAIDAAMNGKVYDRHD